MPLRPPCKSKLSRSTPAGNFARSSPPRRTQSPSAGTNDAAQWHPAVVPGCVHLDLLRNKLIPDPFYRDNEAKLQWIENADWEYRTTIQVTPALLAQKQRRPGVRRPRRLCRCLSQRQAHSDRRQHVPRVAGRRESRPQAGRQPCVWCSHRRSRPRPRSPRTTLGSENARTPKPRPTFARPPTSMAGTGVRASSPAASGVPRGSKRGTTARISNFHIRQLDVTSRCRASARRGRSHQPQDAGNATDLVDYGRRLAASARTHPAACNSSPA